MRGLSFPVYRGYSSQYGAGLGNILGGLVRMAIPRLFKAAVPMMKRGTPSLVEHGIDAISNHFTNGTHHQPRPRAPPKRVARRKKNIKRNAPLVHYPDKNPEGNDDETLYHECRGIPLR